MPTRYTVGAGASRAGAADVRGQREPLLSEVTVLGPVD